MKELKKIIFIVGPTAVGKTDISLLLAKRVKGEIVSCDSMQVYKEINIASNKPPSHSLKETPHHMLNIISVEENFDVSLFNSLALCVIKEIHARNHLPIVVGGSGLYMQILLDGIFLDGKRDEQLRMKLFKDAEEYGKQYLHDMLKEKDPVGAEKIHSNDLKKVVRALEICINKNKPISELQKKREGIWDKYKINIYCMNKERKNLYRIIEDRVDEMFDAGIVEEIESMQSKKLSRGAKSIIGVKELFGYLNGDYDLEHAKYLMKLHTRRLAKRQLTWFRKDKRIKWFNLDEKDKRKIIEEILKENIL